MNSSHDRNAIEVRDLTVSFFEAKDLPQFLVSIPLVEWMLKKIPLLRHYLRRKTVLNKLSFDVRAGSIHGVLGMNAAGKSTVLHCMSGLLTPEGGSISIYGTDVVKLPRGAIDIVSKVAKNELIEIFTAKENIEFLARIYRLDLKAVWKTASRLLSRLGMLARDRTKKPVSRLSYGSQGKVSLVRAIVPLLAARREDGRAPILLLDEPVTGFDVRSVEKFFEALTALREAVPGLTIVVATNDPREAAFCEECTAIVDGAARHDEDLLSCLRKSMQASREGLAAFSKLITAPEEHSAAAMEKAPRRGSPLRLSRIARTAVSTCGAFWWRTWKDLKTSPSTIVLLLISMVLPNLLGYMAAASSSTSWHGFNMAVLGIYASFVVREIYRFLDRERYYKMLETLLLSPLKRFEHFIGTMSVGLANQIVFTGVFAAFLLLTAISQRFLSEAAISLGAISGGDVAGLALLFVATTLALIGIGLLLVLLPFILRPDQSYFLLGMVPTFVIVFSTVYYDPERVPALMRYIAEVNPLSYSAHALSELLHLQPMTPLPLSTLVQQWLPGIAAGWADLLVLTFLSAVLLTVGTLSVHYGEKHLRRIHRFKG